MRLFRVAAAFVGAAFAGLLVTAAGCTLPRAGGLSQRCTLAIECDDGHPCTVESCEADGLCSFEILDGDPPQVNGDCRRAFCLNGFESSEPADDPAPDGNDCTEDGCEDGEPAYVPHEDGKSCNLPEGEGSCVDGE